MADTSEQEIGWVIERYQDTALVYWSGRIRDGAWSHRHEDAIRFAREVDAQIVLGWVLDGNGRAVEHMWISLRGDDYGRHVQVLDCDHKNATIVERRPHKESTNG